MENVKAIEVGMKDLRHRQGVEEKEVRENGEVYVEKKKKLVELEEGRIP